MRKPNPCNVTRRFFLQGSGSVIALPYFASLLPRSARAATSAIDVRYLSYFTPLGMLPQYWRPTTTGANYKLPDKAILAPMAAHTKSFTVVSGTRNAPAGRVGAGAHGQGGASANTGMPNASNNAPKHAGISADQIVANARRKAGRLDSLQLGMPGETGNADFNLAIEYTNSMSWADATTNLPPVTDRNLVLKRLFPNGTVTGDGTSTTTSAENKAANAARMARQQSILDATLAQAKSLQVNMGSEDKARMDQFLSGIREVERSLQSGTLGANCEPLQAMAATDDLDTTFDQWDKIIATAFQCDRTSVVQFMFGAGQSFRRFVNLGINEDHHRLSHYETDFPTKTAADVAPRVEQLRQIQSYTMTRFAKLLTTLKQVKEGTGTLLDNSVVVLFNEMSETNVHKFDDMPVLIAGGAKGKIISNGTHLRSNDNVEFAQVLLASIRAAGVELAALGSSNETRSFPGLLA